MFIQNNILSFVIYIQGIGPSHNLLIRVKKQNQKTPTNCEAIFMLKHLSRYNKKLTVNSSMDSSLY